MGNEFSEGSPGSRCGRTSHGYEGSAVAGGDQDVCAEELEDVGVWRDCFLNLVSGPSDREDACW